jgi:hypothetical protein
MAGRLRTKRAFTNEPANTFRWTGYTGPGTSLLN